MSCCAIREVAESSMMSIRLGILGRPGDRVSAMWGRRRSRRPVHRKPRPGARGIPQESAVGRAGRNTVFLWSLSAPDRRPALSFTPDASLQPHGARTRKYLQVLILEGLK